MRLTPFDGALALESESAPVTAYPPAHHMEYARYEYYLLQARHTTGEVRVALEDLGTGDRWEFASLAELSRFLEGGTRGELVPEPGTDAALKYRPTT